MSQDAELARIKARIRALAAKTTDRGCSEAEALAAAAKVGELLEIYGLTMNAVTLAEETCLERRLASVGPGAVALRWAFPALLRFCGCRGWTEGRATLVLFGLEPDVQMAEWLLHVIEGALAWEVDRFRTTPAYAAAPAAPQVQLRSFRYGFAERIAKRLDTMVQTREAAATARARAPVAGSGGGTALVVAKARKVDAALAATGVRLHQVRRNATVRDPGAFAAGKVAGGRVGLDRPVGAGRGGALPRA